MKGTKNSSLFVELTSEEASIIKGGGWSYQQKQKGQNGGGGNGNHSSGIGA
jgi:hypothetical protein